MLLYCTERYTLHQGDIVIAVYFLRRQSKSNGKRDKGERVKRQAPSVPKVEITGLAEVQEGGDIFNAVSG